MNKRILSLATIALVAGAMVITGCKKEDTTAPTITLVGNAAITQSLPTTVNGGSWVDPGFTAEDNEDGNLTANVVVSGTVDANRKGSYTITYSVSDAAGNSASVTRTVTIVNDVNIYTGAYPNSVDSCQVGGVTAAFNPIATVVESDTVNNLCYITNFGAFGANVKVWATITGTNISITSNQSLGGNAYIQNIYAAPSTMVLSTTSPTKLKVKYQWNDGVNSDVCTTYYQR